MTDLPEFPVRVAVIAGSGLYTLTGNSPEEVATADEPVTHRISTPYASAPVIINLYKTERGQVAFLSRHGADHKIPPHLIPCKANLWALRQLGVEEVVAVNAVGGINTSLTPGNFCVPDQIIDYSWGREHTFFDELGSLNDHIDFTQPYDGKLRSLLMASVSSLQLSGLGRGVYGCTQGPRLETAAEIRRMAQDGCDVVGQTGMPEAALARELGMACASLCLVVNYAAGVQKESISITEIKQHLSRGMEDVRRVLMDVINTLQKSSP